MTEKKESFSVVNDFYKKNKSTETPSVEGQKPFRVFKVRDSNVFSEALDISTERWDYIHKIVAIVTIKNSCIVDSMEELTKELNNNQEKAFALYLLGYHIACKQRNDNPFSGLMR